jgi:hypothetical protein
MKTLQAQPSKLDRAIGIVAALWGACFLLPIGLQYLCLLVLIPLMIASGRLKNLFASWRRERFWWMSVAAFLGITFITLLLQDRYFKETTSNLWHSFRIVATLCVALCLTSEEAWRVMKAALLGLLLMSLLVWAFESNLLPALPFNIRRVIPHGNEWIAMSVLLSMVTVAGIRFIPLGLERGKRQRLALAIIFSIGALLMVLLVMN